MSSSVVPFSSHLQSLPASGSFQMSQFFTSGGQSIGASASASVLPLNNSGLIFFRIDWFDLLAAQGTLKISCSPRVQGTLKSSSPTPQFKSINSMLPSLLYGPILTSIHDYWKNHSFDYVDLFCKVMSLLFNMLSRLVIAFLPRSKHLLISWCSHHLQWFWSPRK